MWTRLSTSYPANIEIARNPDRMAENHDLFNVRKRPKIHSKQADESVIGLYQGNLRGGRSIMNQFSTAIKMLKKCGGFGVYIYQTFVDFKQSYKRIEHTYCTKLCSNLVSQQNKFVSQKESWRANFPGEFKTVCLAHFKQETTLSLWARNQIPVDTKKTLWRPYLIAMKEFSQRR